ncbi:MAG: DUF2142 domain-containing protein [Solirubrobacteraceae bacterium]
MFRAAMPARWLLLASGYVLLLAAWTFSTHPFDAPDETAHYLRAYGLSQGHLLGPHARYSAVTLPPLQDAWVQQDTRGIDVPAAYAPPGVTCVDGRPDLGHCIEASSTGDYQPFAYLVPALALHASSKLGDALWLARAASAVEVAAFFALAAALLWDGTLPSLLGLLVALTPMTLFVGSVLNPNGLELAASLALTAAVVRLSRSPLDSPAWVWTALTASAIATLVSWQLGPVYLALNLALLCGLLGRRDLTALVRARRRRLAAAALLVTLAAALFLAYALHAGAIHSSFHLSPVRHSLQVGIDQLGGVLRQSIGLFGHVSVRLDNVLYDVWCALFAGVVIWGLRVAERRRRRLIALTGLFAIVFPVLFHGFIYRYSGFGLQGRYVLPIVFVPALLSGEAICRSAPRSRAALSGVGGCALLVAAVQLAAWWKNAQVNAGFPGPSLPSPLSGARWLPPGGWLPWSLCAALGALAVALALAPVRLAPGRWLRSSA